MGPEAQFEEFDKDNRWQIEYHKIREATRNTDHTLNAAKQPNYRSRNRYRDVSPYDHSRVVLKRNGIDYINASLVKADAANRSYILTQGPLEDTAGHFWLMVWERNSRAVLMLNNIYEKRVQKCHPYFPTGEAGCEVMQFDDVALEVSYISEQDAGYYTLRTLRLLDIQSGQSKEVLQFHYTTWPDFGVPESPAHFLDFLFAVRASGALDTSVGPPVIHCSAGIGRSGTFCLVDTCLVLIEQQQDKDAVNVLEVLLSLRQYRMGLIQTHDQLRFSFLAIIQGTRRVLHTLPDDEDALTSSTRRELYVNHTEHFDDDDIPDEPPPPPPRVYPGVRPPSDDEIFGRPGKDVADNDHVEDVHRNSEATELRRRKREERLKNTASQIAEMKAKQQASEKWKERKSKMKPYVIGLSLVFLGGCFFLYKYYIS